MTHRVPELREYAERYTSAWCSQDPASVAAFFSEDGSLRLNDGPSAVGRAAITGVVLSFMTAFPDLQVAMDDLKVSGYEAEYHWTLTGATTGAAMSGQECTHQRRRNMASGARWTDCVFAGKFRRGQLSPAIGMSYLFVTAHDS
jgi:hypothetical protein